MADDVSWHDLGPYGCTDVPTPNIDRLALEGLRFDMAFQSTAMCAPTRQQFLTMDSVTSNKKVALFTDNEQDGIIMGNLWTENVKKFGYEIVASSLFHVGKWKSSFPPII